MDLYDQFLYTPLQTSLLPVVCKIPRTVVFSNKSYTVFTANIVSYSRTILVIPIAICLKYEHTVVAFFSKVPDISALFSLVNTIFLKYDMQIHKVPVPYDSASIGHPARLPGSRGWNRG